MALSRRLDAPDVSQHYKYPFLLSVRLVIIHSVPDEAVRPKQLSCSIILFDHRTISGD